jgi:hypothetical protein
VGGALVEHADAEERGGLHDRGHLVRVRVRVRVSG